MNHRIAGWAKERWRRAQQKLVLVDGHDRWSSFQSVLMGTQRLAHPSARSLDPHLRATLHTELREVAKDLALRPLLQREPNLLPRFARSHDYLTHLPRKARRALQCQ